MPKPRVLVFTLAYFPFVGGAEVAVKEIMDRLPDYEFEIVSADLSKGFWEKYLFPWRGFKRAVAKHQEKKFDLVWAIMANQAGMAAVKFKKRHPDVPFLLTLQEGDDLTSLKYRLRLLGPKLFGVFKKANQIQAISHYLANWAKKMGATCPITVIPNGVDLSFPLRPLRPAVHNNIEKLVITTSRLVEKNGVADLIEAMTYLPDNIRLQIVGGGPLEADLKRRVNNNHLENRVEFVGSVPPNQIPSYLDKADVFARPSLSEGLGNSFIEAMAIGLPTIGTAVGGIVDFLREGETGWLVPVKNPKALANKIAFILDPANKEKVEQVCSTGQFEVRERYSWNTVAERMKMLFNQLIK